MAIVEVTAFVFILFTLAQWARNIWFHPLSHIPGPLLWTASQAPSLFHLVTGRLLRQQQRLHDMYGSVVRLGPNEVSFATEEACNDIYNFRPGHKLPAKDPIFYHAPNGMVDNIVTTGNPKTHARLRKALGYSLSPEATAMQAPIIEAHATRLVQSLALKAPGGHHKGIQVNLAEWINFFTVDVIGDLALGESIGCLESENLQVWASNLSSFFLGMVLSAAARCYSSLEFMIKACVPTHILHKQAQHIKFTRIKIERRLNLETQRPDFMTALMRENEAFESFSRAELESNFALLLVAGSETTATVTTGIMHHLLKHPSIMAKLQSIVRDRYQALEDITVASSRNVSYLDAVINEGLRVCNPVPGGLPRVVPPGGDVYGGIYVPEGVRISGRPYCIVRSEDYFAHAKEFIPDRWLSEPEQHLEFVKDKRSASRPFSTGPNGCMGMALAWAEMRLLVCKLLWAFEFDAPTKDMYNWDDQPSFIITLKQALPIGIRVRRGFEVK